MKRLAVDLLSIAKDAMPDSYYESDKRCQFARYVLSSLKMKKDKK